MRIGRVAAGDPSWNLSAVRKIEVFVEHARDVSLAEFTGATVKQCNAGDLARGGAIMEGWKGPTRVRSAV